jgi:hypothetical protein
MACIGGVVALPLLFPAASEAFINMRLVELPDGTLSLEATGSANTAALTSGNAVPAGESWSHLSSRIEQNRAEVRAGNDAPQGFFWSGASYLSPNSIGDIFKSSLFQDVLSSSGPRVGFFSTDPAVGEVPAAGLYLPSNYKSGDQFLAAATFTPLTSGQTLVPGLYTMRWGSGADADGLNLCIGNEFTADCTPVPGPLPFLGAAAAFGYSRKLRRRIAPAGEPRSSRPSG